MSGLENIEVCESGLSLIDGAEGRLLILHQEVQSWVNGLALEEIPGVMWGLAGDLRQARVEAERRLGPHRPLLQGLAPVESLGLGLALLGTSDDPYLLAAATAVALQRNAGPVDPELSVAHDFLRLYFDKEPNEAEVQGLETYWKTVCEHGLNASTFACRVVASTGADLSDAVLAGLCALKGPLHGGAPGPVLDLLEELRAGDPERTIVKKVEAGERIMGFGHRVYKVRDPRAEVLRKAAGRLRSPRLRWAQDMEKLVEEVLGRLKPGRNLFANVEFYTAVLLDTLGFERDMFTPLFACGRVFGWLAHAMEQRREGRLIRPKSRYRPPQAV